MAEFNTKSTKLVDPVKSEVNPLNDIEWRMHDEVHDLADIIGI